MNFAPLRPPSFRHLVCISLLSGVTFKEAKVIKSYLVVLFVTCFLFSLDSDAKLLTTKEVAAKKLKNKQQTSKSQLKKASKPERKVVRLDFDQPAPVKNKTKKENKVLAKGEAPKFKSIECHNGFIVGQKAYCSTAKTMPKKGRSVASVPKQNKKLKSSKRF